LSTYQWQNIVDAWRKNGSSGGGQSELSLLMGGTSGSPSVSLLPFSPSIDRWTDDHYTIYSLVELELGNRKEVPPEEQAEINKAQEIDELIESGDPDWLQKVEEYFSEGYNIDDIPIDENFVGEIEKEENSRQGS